jgi:hypothetical protein
MRLGFYLASCQKRSIRMLCGKLIYNILNMNSLLISIVPTIIVTIILVYLWSKSNSKVENNKKFYLIGILVGIASIVLTIYYS